MTDVDLGQTVSYISKYYKFITDVIMSAECIMEYVVLCWDEASIQLLFMIWFSVGKELDNLEHSNNDVDLKELVEYTVSGASVGHRFKSLLEVYLH